MIDWLMKKKEKQIYKIYNLTMLLVVISQLVLLLIYKDWISGVGIGFNAGLWSGFTLARVLR